jgi:hypothetical protein
MKARAPYPFPDNDVRIVNIIMLALIIFPIFHIGMEKVCGYLGIGFSPHVANFAALSVIGLFSFLSFRTKR